MNYAKHPSFIYCFIYVALILLATSFNSLCQVYEGRELVRASLVPAQNAVVPGQPFTIGILLEIADGWHVYWRNPGDAGLATSIEWELPEGFSANQIQWPIPKRLAEPGNLIVYGYKNQVFFPFRIEVASQFQGSEASLKAKVRWLVCEALCLPGEAELDLTLPVAEKSTQLNSEIFQSVEATLPKPLPANVQLQWQEKDKGWTLHIQGLPQWAQEVTFFPYEHSIPPNVEQPSPAKVENQQTSLFIPAEGKISGVLAWQSTDTKNFYGVEISSPTKTPAADFQKKGLDNPEVSKSVPVFHSINLLTALGLGFLGGFLLNLMPCVLPVISLKIFSFLRQAGDSPKKIFAHGLAFCAGIFAWFVGLAAVVVALRAGGAQVAWAFQFQNPWFIYFLCIVVFIFSLNLFGVFEFSLPARTSSQLSSAAQSEGLAGSFLHGLFATLLATPCTAPLLGIAIGFAFSQSALVIFSTFTAVAAGMAIPYLLLALNPGWLNLLPKPGPWMETLKQTLGFPMAATLLWLLSVLGVQKGTNGIIWTLCTLLLLAVPCWLYGKFFTPTSSLVSRRVSLAVILACLAAIYWVSTAKFAKSQISTSNHQLIQDSKPQNLTEWSKIP
ncbi:MAG: protein-disulfide reductase DsbD family protein, partial [Chthoniobacterales bacterium]|nr:protein-disulfide reductase DsbD family protein [Chthoniobacterales bacterium]